MSTETSELATSAPTLAEITRQRFPLVPRPKPACQPLNERVSQVRSLADLARQHTDESLTRAAEACNLAALIASDCGMPTLARDLCRRQFDAFTDSGPATVATAKLTLQPLINIGRLNIRDGDGTSAYQLLEGLFTAAKDQATTVIHGRRINFGRLVADATDHRELVRWLWTVLLADGTRALTRAGRWSEALQHAQRHKGIGQRLFDGRQVAILAHCAAHDHDNARGLLATTTLPTPWEQVVAACLKAVCLKTAGTQSGPATATMLDRYLALLPDPKHAAFHARLGLCVAALAGDNDRARAAEITAKLVKEAVASADAYTAWDVMPHISSQAGIRENDRHTLADLIESSGLHRGALPANLQADLLNSVRISEREIQHALGTMPGTLDPSATT